MTEAAELVLVMNGQVVGALTRGDVEKRRRKFSAERLADYGAHAGDDPGGDTSEAADDRDVGEPA